MDQEGFAFGAFIAAEEKRRAEIKAEQEKQQLKAEYDRWCTDHGVPPPPAPRPVPQSRDGSVSLGLIVIGIILFVFLWIIMR